MGIGETLIHQKYPWLKWIAVEYIEKLAREYQLRFPGSQVVVMDAYEYIYAHYKEFDKILCSPPCQSYSRLTRFGRGQPPVPDERIITLIDFLHHHHSCWWVENVDTPWLWEHTPLTPVKIGRHLWWSNIKLENHFKEPKKDFRFDKCTTARDGLSAVETHVQDLQNWLGVKLSRRYYVRGNHCPSQIYREGIHPQLGLYVFEQLFQTLLLGGGGRFK